MDEKNVMMTVMEMMMMTVVVMMILLVVLMMEVMVVVVLMIVMMVMMITMSGGLTANNPHPGLGAQPVFSLMCGLLSLHIAHLLSSHVSFILH